jgi:SAM-dependent methyltransferase
VGIADDFYEISNYPSARAVLTELFPDSFEWAEGPVEATLKKMDRKFDVVLFSEGLCHRRDPFSLLEAVADACAETLVLCSPFVIDNSEVPWVAHFPEYTPEGARRDVSSPNRLWLANTLQELGFDLEEFRTWEHDFASIHAIRRPLIANRSMHLIPSITDLPVDEGFESDLAVLMITCQRYSSAWHPFFVLFKRYWPECPYRVYMGTDKGSYSNIPTLQTGDDGSAKNWAQRLRSVRPLVTLTA